MLFLLTLTGFARAQSLPVPVPVSMPVPMQAAVTKTAVNISVGDFFRLPRYSQMSISPDGKRLATLAPVKGRDNLAVINLDSRSTTIITGFADIDVGDFMWVSNDRLAFRTVNQRLETGTPQFVGAFAVDVDGQNLRNLAALLRRIRLFRAAGDGSGDLIIGSNVDNAPSESVLRMDTRTGRTKLLTYQNPGQVVGWALGADGSPKAALRVEDRVGDEPRKRSLWVRQTSDGQWQRAGDAVDEADAIRPLAFSHSDQSLIVTARNNADRLTLYSYDLTQKKLGKVLFEHPWLDIDGGLIRHPKTHAVLGVRYNAEKPQTHWFDDQYASLQISIDAALPNTVNTLSPGSDEANSALVFAQSDTDSGTYYLLNTANRSLERVASTRDWLPKALMATRQFVGFKARDGLPIAAWLTLPQGSNGKNLPLIVHVHGGPWSRSFGGVDWGRWPTAQFFASRGYAVLETEPRGSTGFGTKHLQASYKQWGLAMQDDITDGALHLVSLGVADKARMCLHGGSYGGYAALQGVVKDPDLWRCANAYVAVTDLDLLQNVAWSDTARGSDYFSTDFKRQVGDSARDRAQFEATSPAKNADKIKAAVMLTMGAQDVRVPIIHGTTMVDAMKKAGKSIDYKIYSDEGHGFNRADNVIDFYSRTEQFFAKHLR